MTDTLYVVDGYNVLHALHPTERPEDLADARRWLIDRLAGFAALRDARVCLVFDAHGRPGTTCETVRGTRVEVCYAGGRFTADTLIARRIAERQADVAVVVVSADQEVQRTASRAGVTRMTPRELGAELGADDPMHDKKLANCGETDTIRRKVEDEVDVETWRRLDRMRREGQ